MLNKEQIEEIEARREAAAPGPWQEGQEGNLRVYGPDGQGTMSGLIAEVFKGRANVRFIANAPTDISALLASHKALEAEVERWKPVKEAMPAKVRGYFSGFPCTCKSRLGEHFAVCPITIRKELLSALEQIEVK